MAHPILGASWPALRSWRPPGCAFWRCPCVILCHDHGNFTLWWPTQWRSCFIFHPYSRCWSRTESPMTFKFGHLVSCSQQAGLDYMWVQRLELPIAAWHSLFRMAMGPNFEFRGCWCRPVCVFFELSILHDHAIFVQSYCRSWPMSF